MEKRGFLVLAIFIVMIGFFSANYNAVTGQAVAEVQENKFPRHIEVTEGQVFLLPDVSAAGYIPVTFSEYDPLNKELLIKSNRGNKIFIAETTTPSFFSSTGATADLVYSGKTIKVAINDKSNYPDNQRHKLYLLTYANEDDLVNVGETLAFSETSFCRIAGCEGSNKEVWTLDNIDPSDQTITFSGLLSFTRTKEFSYEAATGNVDIIVQGQTYRGRIEQVTLGTYALRLSDPKFHIMNTNNVGIVYYS